MTKNEAANLRSDLNSALKQIEAKYKMKFEIGTIRFGTDEVRMTLRGASVAATSPTGAKVITQRELANLVYNANLYKVPVALDKVYMLQGHAFKVTGYNARGKKYPILGTEVDGRGIKLSWEQMRRAVEMVQPTPGTYTVKKITA